MRRDLPDVLGRQRRADDGGAARRPVSVAQRGERVVVDLDAFLVVPDAPQLAEQQFLHDGGGKPAPASAPVRHGFLGRPWVRVGEQVELPAAREEKRHVPGARTAQGLSASGAAAPGSGATVNASCASRAAVAGLSPATTRWIAPIWGGKAAESTSSARPASHGPAPAPAVRLRA